MQAIHVQDRSGTEWFVTNGHAVVGPVDTQLLLRGISHGRVPDDCKVAQAGWGDWRSLEQIREVRAHFRTRSLLASYPLLGDSLSRDPVTQRAKTLISVAARDHALRTRHPSVLLKDAKDAGEVFLLSLHLAVKKTHADTALLHRIREPLIGYVTSCAHGPRACTELGQVLSPHDAALGVARRGHLLVGHPDSSAAARSASLRLIMGERLPTAVALVPLRVGDRLLGLIELGRLHHGFRSSDIAQLATLTEATTTRLSRLK